MSFTARLLFAAVLGFLLSIGMSAVFLVQYLDRKSEMFRMNTTLAPAWALLEVSGRVANAEQRLYYSLGAVGAMFLLAMVVVVTGFGPRHEKALPRKGLPPLRGFDVIQ